MKRIRPVLIIVLALAGLGLILYPIVSNQINLKNQSSAINETIITISELRAEEIEAELQRAYDYNAALGEIVLVNPPFTGESDEGADELYDSELSLTSIMCYLEIPKIDLKMAVYHGTSDETLATALGHLQGTSLPVGGESTHAVITGHRGLPSAMLFTDLDKMEIGDMFYIHVLDRVLAYKVDEINVIDPQDTELLQIVPGEDYVTLMTCTPYGINSHRLLVCGVRVELSEEEIAAEETRANGGVTLTQILLFAGIVLLAVAAIVAIVRAKNRVRVKNSKKWIYKDDKETQDDLYYRLHSGRSADSWWTDGDDLSALPDDTKRTQD